MRSTGRRCRRSIGVKRTAADRAASPDGRPPAGSGPSGPPGPTADRAARSALPEADRRDISTDRALADEPVAGESEGDE